MNLLIAEYAVSLWSTEMGFEEACGVKNRTARGYAIIVCAKVCVAKIIDFLRYINHLQMLVQVCTI